jgi:superfamily II DNA or RNA helicase
MEEMGTRLDAAPWRVGARVLVRGRRWRVQGIETGRECSALHLQELGADAGARLTILTPFDRPTTLDRDATLTVVCPRRWLHELDRVLVQVHPQGSMIAAARTSVRVMPYQFEPALAIFRHAATRVLIADAVGLGKTIQAGLILVELIARTEGHRALVLVPAGLREQWSAELEAHFGIAATTADAAWLARTAAERPAHVNPWSLPGTYIASHDFVKRPEALMPLEEVPWDLVVVDEAHAATSGTDRRAAIHAIASRALRVVLLTATPHADDPDELCALCGIGRLGEADRGPTIFARTRMEVDPVPPRRSSALSVAPSDSEARMHRLLEQYSTEVWREATARGDDRARLASIVLRKRSLSSAGSLAVSIRRRLELLAAEPQPAAWQLNLPLAGEDVPGDEEPVSLLGAPGLSNVKLELRWLGAIGEAAGAAARAETKTRFLMRLLRRLREPVIVFTEYRDTLSRLQLRLAAAGIRPLALHGGLSPSERSLIVRRFSAGGETLLATDAAAEGLNLHRTCRTLIHYELPWNPARLEQRAGRVDRIGQLRRVHEIALVAADTAERMVVARLVRRQSHRPGPFEGSRMLGALTESRVAGAVMSGPLPPECRAGASPPAQLVDVVLADYRQQAVIEGARVEWLRRLIARSGPHDRPPLANRVFASACVSKRSGAPPAVLKLLYLIEVESATGRRLHADVAGFDLWPGARISRSPSRSWVRAMTERHMRPSNERLVALLKARADEAIDRVSRLERALAESARVRQAAVDAAPSGAAGRLVQPRLFGPRQGDERARTSPASDRGSSLGFELTGLRIRVALVAALLCGDRSTA